MANSVTPSPTASTTSATSPPGIAGNRAGNAFPLRIFQSIGLTDAARTVIRTWLGPGAGTGRSATLSTLEALYSENSTARYVLEGV